MSNRNSKDGTAANSSTTAEVTTSSQTIAKPNVIRWASFNDEMPKEGQLVIVYEWQYDAYATYFEFDKDADYSNSWWCLPPIV